MIFLNLYNARTAVTFSPIAVVVAAAFLLLGAPLQAQDGELDVAFNNTGILRIPVDQGGDFADVIEDILVQPDHKIVVVGHSSVGIADDEDFVLYRLNEDGSLDINFGLGGESKRSF